MEDFAEVELDGGGVFGLGESEHGAASAAAGELARRDGASRGVVEVAEGFVAKRGRAAAVAVGEDMTALIGRNFGFKHDGYPTPGVIAQNLELKRVRS